jgi:plasmid stabilization system protein ParE
MKRFKLSPEAAQDIREIWAYIAADSPALIASN